MDLTPEQLATIAANRQEALQRQDQRKRVFDQHGSSGESQGQAIEAAAKAGAVVNAVDGMQPIKEPRLGEAINLQAIQQRLAFKQPTEERAAATTAPGRSLCVQPEAKAGAAKRQKTAKPVVLQLDSPHSFTCTAAYDMVSQFRSTPGAHYNKTENVWQIPLSEYAAFVPKIPPERRPATFIPKSVLALFEPAMVERRLQGAREPFDLQSLDAPLREALFPFQAEGIQTGLQRHGRVMLADDMGLGKSIQALGMALYYRHEWPLLIVTPASMVATWAEQVMRWVPSLSADAIDVIYDGKGVLKGRVSIISYDMAVRLIEDIRKRHFRVIIADESHAIRNRDIKRCRSLLPVFKASDRLFLLSGTPALSRPIELFSQIEAIAPKTFPKFTEYGMRYCNGHRTHFGWDWRGASCTRELQLVLEQTIMIRRIKEQVLSQLPPKTRQQVFLKIPASELAAFSREQSRVHLPGGKQQSSLQSVDADALALLQGKSREDFMHLWRRTAQIKLPAIQEYVSDLLDSGHKMLVFAHHQFVLDALQDHLHAGKCAHIRIDGQTAASTRQSLCDQFQGDPRLRVALLSITAASTGLTLTAATTVLFAELFFNPGILTQAEDRAHRIGQTDNVNVHYLLARGTTDDHIWYTGDGHIYSAV